MKEGLKIIFIRTQPVMNGDYQGYYWDYTLEWDTTNIITGTSLESRTTKVSIGTSLEQGTTKDIIGTSIGWETTRVFYVTAWNKKGVTQKLQYTE